jgi:hypothetical protein
VSELDSDPYPVPLAQPPAPSSDSDYSSVEEIEDMEEELAEDDSIEDINGEERGGKENWLVMRLRTWMWNME